MAWKYVVFEDESGVQIPFVFPDRLVHLYVATVLPALLNAHGVKNPKLRSAGVIDGLDLVGGATGDSETLNITSHLRDTVMIETYSYTHGVESPMMDLVAATMRRVPDE